MAWLQDTKRSLTEKVSRAEGFYSCMLLRLGFRNWLKVCLHHSGETAPSQLAAATLSPHHSATSHTCSPAFAELHCSHSSNTILLFRDLLSALHSPSLSSTQDTLLCTASPPLHCRTLLPADFPPTPVPLPFTATASAPVCFCLFSFILLMLSPSHLLLCPPLLVQGLSLCSGGESKYPPCSLPHEEVLLGMV